MTVVCTTCLLRALAVISTLPQTGKLSGLAVGKDARTVDDPRQRRLSHGNLNDIDTEQGGAGVAGDRANTARQFALVTD
ncbi:hypothetical protein D3C80_1327740 [compost metagenome]